MHQPSLASAPALLALIAGVSLALAGSAAAKPKKPPPPISAPPTTDAQKAPPVNAPPPATSNEPSQQVETSAQANRDGFTGAAKAPLRDLNLIRTKIPQVLLEALADPY